MAEEGGGVLSSPEGMGVVSNLMHSFQTQLDMVQDQCRGLRNSVTDQTTLMSKVTDIVDRQQKDGVGREELDDVTSVIKLQTDQLFAMKRTLEDCTARLERLGVGQAAQKKQTEELMGQLSSVQSELSTLGQTVISHDESLLRMDASGFTPIAAPDRGDPSNDLGLQTTTLTFPDDNSTDSPTTPLGAPRPSGQDEPNSIEAKFAEFQRRTGKSDSLGFLEFCVASPLSREDGRFSALAGSPKYPVRRQEEEEIPVNTPQPAENTGSSVPDPYPNLTDTRSDLRKRLPMANTITPELHKMWQDAARTRHSGTSFDASTRHWLRMGSPPRYPPMW